VTRVDRNLLLRKGGIEGLSIMLALTSVRTGVRGERKNSVYLPGVWTSSSDKSGRKAIEERTSCRIRGASRRKFGPRAQRLVGTRAGNRHPITKSRISSEQREVAEDEILRCVVHNTQAVYFSYAT
jgi:hypothetical protein